MELVKNLNKSNLQTVSSVKIEEQFVKTFNNIFDYNNENISVIGSIDKPYFKAKDALKILGYSENKSTIKNIIHKYIPEKYKFQFGGLHGVDHSNEAKEIYISEAGLYRLIMRSNKPSAEPFQDFVQDTLLPNIRKQVVENYISENNSLKHDVQVMLNQNNQLIKQNQLALSKLEEMGIKLEENKEQLDEIQEELFETNNKLDRALPNRNVDPDSKELNHHYILFKNKSFDNEYVFVRGQDRYIKNKKNEFKAHYEITVDKTKTPNPIDLVNRLKERIQLINERSYWGKLEELKNCDDYINATSSAKRKMILETKNKYSKIIYKANKISLKEYTEEEFLNLVKRLENDKYDI